MNEHFRMTIFITSEVKTLVKWVFFYNVLQFDKNIKISILWKAIQDENICDVFSSKKVLEGGHTTWRFGKLDSF